ncbi:MAG: sensor histidine kinase [Phycisphaerales bacterium]
MPIVAAGAAAIAHGFGPGVSAAAALLGAGSVLTAGVMLRRADGRQLAAAVERGDLSDEAAQAAVDAGIDSPELRDAVLSLLTSASGTNETLRAAELRSRVAESDARQLIRVLDGLRDAVIVTNGFDEVVLINQAARTLFAAEMPASGSRPHLSQLVGQADVVRSVVEARERGAVNIERRTEFEVPGASIATPTDDQEAAHVRVCEAVLLPWADAGDRPEGVVLVLHDTTRERELAAMKTDFVAKASHELRTPLSSIRAYVEMLVDGEAADEDARDEFYGIIQGEADRLGRLIDNMLNISRIEAGIISIDREPVDLADVIAQAIDTVGPQATAKDLGLTLRPVEVDLVVEGDRDMLAQVLVNLISNAVKYTPEGGRVSITADTDNLTRAVVISVADTGLGIPPDSLDRVFEKFYRIDNYKRVAKGTGLGLNLCRHIVETVHKGQIGVESQLGMGSRFWFSVPMKWGRERRAAA